MLNNEYMQDFENWISEAHKSSGAWGITYAIIALAYAVIVVAIEIKQHK